MKKKKRIIKKNIRYKKYTCNEKRICLRANITCTYEVYVNNVCNVQCVK